MRYKLTSNDQKLSVVRDLEASGLHTSALLSSLELKVDRDNIDIALYLFDDILRFQDYLYMFSVMGFIKKVDSWGGREKNIALPLMRVSFECLFDSLYVFGGREYWEEPQNSEGVHCRFEEVKERNIGKYEMYYKSVDLINKTAPPHQRKGSTINVKDSIKKALNTMRAGLGIDDSVDKLYLKYRYLCLYSHGNINRGVMRSTGDFSIPAVKAREIISLISRLYLIILEPNLRCELLTSKIKAASKEDV